MRCEPLFPLSSGDLTTEQRAALVAEKRFNLEAERNGGKPTSEGYRNLYQAYKSARMDLHAAQALEEMNDMYPNDSNLNEIGVLFSIAGHKEKALKYYEKAYKSNPTNSIIAFNLAFQYKNIEQNKFIDMLETVLELEPNNPMALFEKGKLLNKNSKGDGIGLIENAFNTYKEKFDNNHLNGTEFSWFASCADELGKTDLAQLIRDSEPRNEAIGLWNEGNLTQSKNNEGLIKL
jgi:tetratricopeptide (TPR) repeat protein